MYDKTEILQMEIRRGPKGEVAKKMEARENELSRTSSCKHGAWDGNACRRRRGEKQKAKCTGA